MSMFSNITDKDNVGKKLNLSKNPVFFSYKNCEYFLHFYSNKGFKFFSHGQVCRARRALTNHVKKNLLDFWIPRTLFITVIFISVLIYSTLPIISSRGEKKNILKENEDETISFFTITTQYYHLFFLSFVVANISKKLFNVEHNLISWVDIYFILLIHFWIEAVKCLWAHYWSFSKSVTIGKIIDVLWISSSTVKFCKVTLNLTKLMISSEISHVEYNLLKFHEV